MWRVRPFNYRAAAWPDKHSRPHERAHVAIHERQEQGGDVLAVHIGVGHEDDLAVAQLADVEFLADAGAEGGDEVLDRIGAQCPIQTRLFPR